MPDEPHNQSESWKLKILAGNSPTTLPLDGNDPNYLQELIAQLVRSINESFNKYSHFVRTCEKLTFRRRDKKWHRTVRRFDIQDEFLRAIRHNHVPVTEPKLTSIISLADRNHSGKIKLKAFQDLVPQLPELVDQVAEDALQGPINSHTAQGKAWLEEETRIGDPILAQYRKLVLGPLPCDWKCSSTSVVTHSDPHGMDDMMMYPYRFALDETLATWIFLDELGCQIWSNTLPCDPSSFGTIYGVATEVAISTDPAGLFI
jgi:hypothetical protein